MGIAGQDPTGQGIAIRDVTVLHHDYDVIDIPGFLLGD